MTEKYARTPKQVAAGSIAMLAEDAVKRIQAEMKNADELSGKESKLSDSAKAYFADQSRVYRLALIEARRIQRDLMDMA